MEILKVSSKSNPSKVAGAIANIFREKGSVEIKYMFTFLKYNYSLGKSISVKAPKS